MNDVLDMIAQWNATKSPADLVMRRRHLKTQPTDIRGSLDTLAPDEKKKAIAALMEIEEALQKWTDNLIAEKKELEAEMNQTQKSAAAVTAYHRQSYLDKKDDRS